MMHFFALGFYFLPFLFCLAFTLPALVSLRHRDLDN